jgi:hypothetical protein
MFTYSLVHDIQAEAVHGNVLSILLRQRYVSPSQKARIIETLNSEEL